MAMNDWTAYIPLDRRRALAQGQSLPNRATGAALFADISGFTPLTQTLVKELGRKHGAEAILGYINPIYEAVIAELHRYGSSVIDFVGDAVICWLNDLGGSAAPRAVACGLAMQQAMQQFATIYTPGGTPLSLSIKVGVAAGPARRFLIGNPDIQVMDVLAGATLQRMAGAEEQAQTGQVVVSQEVVEALGDDLAIREWRTGPEGRLAVVQGLVAPAATQPGPPPLTRVGFSPEAPDVNVWAERAKPCGLKTRPPKGAGPSQPDGLPSGIPGDPENLPLTGPPPLALTMAQVRPWILPAVYERLQTGESFLGDLRPVTSLFLRFGGPDYDADDAAGEKLDAFVRWAQAIVHRYGGGALRLTIGDKGAFLYAPFGAPVAHEDDTRRALAAALALQAPPPALAWLEPTQIGISRGEVWAGVYGSATRHTYSVLGNEVNLAARLMTAATPGQVLVSGRVSRQPGFRFTHVGDQTYRGLAAPIPTYELLGEQIVGERLFNEAMVGREAELQWLVDLAQPLFAGRLAGVVCMYGEPGIGKSRLSFALRQALGDRVTWFTGQADQVLRQPFNPFIYWLKRYFHQSPQATPEENKHHFEQRMGQLVRDLDRLSPVQGREPDRLRDELVRTRSILGALLGLHWPNSLYEQLDARGRYENTLAAVRSVLLAASCLRPVVLELEDGQWLDEVSHDLLAAITRNIAGYPLLLLIISRYADDGSRPAFAAAAEVPTFSLDLDPLAADALRALGQDILGGPLDEALYALVLARSQANPLFAQQILRYFQENGLLAQTAAGNWTIRQPLQGADLPPTLNAILIARIDRLTHRVKEVVQAAAVLGREFEVQVLSRMLQADVSEPVQQAQREQIWLLIRELRYMFKHTLLRDAAYEMQLRARRRELHYLAAQASEQLYAATLPAHYGDLAYHYEAACQLGADQARDRARHYLHQAGTQAAAGFENAAAVDYFSRALALTPTADARRYALLLAREQVYNLLGARPAQAQDLATLAELAETLGDDRQRAEVALRQASYAELTGDYAAAIELDQAAIRLAQASQDIPLQVAALRQWGDHLSAHPGRWGVHRFTSDRAAVQAHLEQALTLARSAALPQDKARILIALGRTFHHAQDHAQAADCYEQALRLVREMGDRPGERQSLGLLGNLYNSQHDLIRSGEYHEQELQVAREIGDRRGEASALTNLGNVADWHGDYARSRACYEAALPIWREIGHRMGEGIVYINLIWVARDLGEYQVAYDYGQRALQIALAIGDPYTLVCSLLGLGGVLVGLARFDEARESYQQAIAAAHENNAPHYAIEARAGLARVALAQNDLPTARDHVAEIVRYWRTNPALHALDDPFLVYLTCCQVLYAAGEPRADEILESAYGQLQALAARISDEQTRRSFLENVPSNRNLAALWRAQHP